MIVQLPNGETAEFPDSMSQREVEYYLKNSQIEPEYSPDMSAGDAVLVGAGESFDSLGRGIKNLYAKVTGDTETQGQMKAENEEANRLMEPVKSEYGGSVMAGSMLPALATMPLSGGLLAQMGIGAAIGAADYNDNQGMQGTLGGALSGIGYGIGKAAPKVMNAVKGGGKWPSLSGEAGRLAGRADDIGMTLMPGARTGSTPLQQLDASIKSSPTFSGIPEAGIKENQRILNELAADSIGEFGDEITPHMLGSAAKRIGNVYENVAKDVKNINFSNGKLQQFYNDLSTDSIDTVNSYIKRFPGLGSGKMSTKEWGKLRQVVAKDARNAWRSKPSSAEDLESLQFLLMDALEDNVGGGAKQSLQVAGKQWRNLKLLERGKTVTKANVNPRSLDTGLRNVDKGGYLRGRNTSDYYDAVRAANMFSDIVGDSGTATRSWLGRLTTEPQAVVSAYLMRPVVRSYIAGGKAGRSAAGLLGAAPGSARVAGETAGAFRAGLMGYQ